MQVYEVKEFLNNNPDKQKHLLQAIDLFLAEAAKRNIVDTGLKDIISVAKRAKRTKDTMDDFALAVVSFYDDAMGELEDDEAEDVSTAEEVVSAVINLLLFLIVMLKMINSLFINAPIFKHYRRLSAIPADIDVADFYLGPSFGKTRDYSSDIGNVNTFVFTLFNDKKYKIQSPDGSDDYCAIFSIAPDYPELFKKDYTGSLASMPIEFVIDFDSYETEDQQECNTDKAGYCALGKLSKYLTDVVENGFVDPFDIGVQP